MTFEEAKKILKKEMVISFHSTKPFVFDESGWIEHEKPSVLEAFRVLAKGGYYISISGHDYNMREKRLKKEYEKNTKAPNPAKNLIKGNFPGNKSIKYCGDSMPGPGEEQPKEGNPALEEAASQFNDALLNEQGKKIKHLTKKISRLNKIIHKKNEELRLTKIREKNLAELGLKYVGENEKLKKKLADKIVDEIDAQALKSAESALAYKEKVIAEKDEVIADLGKELAEAKKLNTAKILDINAKCMRAARESINDVFESYAAKYAKSTLDELKDNAYESFNAKAHNLGLVGSKDGNGIIDQMEEDSHPTEDNPEEVELDEILEYVRKALEEGHTVSIDYDKAEEGGDQSVTIVQCDNGIILSKEEVEIIERCTKNGTELHYSEKDGFTYTNVFGDEIPIICLRGMFHVFTDKEIENMKK